MAGSHGNVLLMTSRQQFDNAILECTTNGKLMLIDFTASWCGPCKMIAPLFAELSEKYVQIHFAKVDVDDLQEVAAEYEVRAMPTFVMVKEGKEVARVVGMEPVGLELMIKSSLTDLDHAAA